MVDKPIPPDSHDQDSWENLAKDLFGVEFNSPPVSPDDLEDELLNDDFLKDEEEPATAETEEPGEPAEQAESPAAAEESEPVAETFLSSEQVAEPEEPVAAESPEANLDALLDFSKPYGEEEAGVGAEEAETAEQESPEPAPNLFEKLAAETDETMDEASVDSAEIEEDDLEIEDDSDEEDEQYDTDDFWDVLEEFAPEELGTPHIDQGQSRGGKPPRDPEIGLVAGVPENELTESPDFHSEFDTDSDFGLGILEDVETDEDEEDDETEAAEADSSQTAEEGQEPERGKKPGRRRRRRRRGSRRKKSPSADSDENAADAEAEAADDEAVSEEEQEDDFTVSRSAGSSRYKNIPTWSEAIDLIVDRKPKSSSENRGRRGNRSEAKNRKRGGRRRRSRKSNS